MLLKARIIQSTIIGLMSGALYFGDGTLDYMDPTNWQTIIGMFFLLSVASIL